MPAPIFDTGVPDPMYENADLPSTVTTPPRPVWGFRFVPKPKSVAHPYYRTGVKVYGPVMPTAQNAHREER